MKHGIKTAPQKSLPQIPFNQPGKAGSLSPELAKFLLAIEFDPTDERRANELAAERFRPLKKLKLTNIDVWAVSSSL